MNGFGLLILMALVLAVVVLARGWRQAVLERDDARMKQRELGRRLLVRTSRDRIAVFTRRAA